MMDRCTYGLDGGDGFTGALLVYILIMNYVDCSVNHTLMKNLLKDETQPTTP